MTVKQTNCAIEALTFKEIWPDPRKVPVMVIVTYDSDGATIHHTISDNQNVTSEYYHKLHPAEQQKEPHSSTGTPPLMMHKNAHCHVKRLGAGLLA